MLQRYEPKEQPRQPLRWPSPKIQDIEVIVDGYRRMKTIGTEGPCQGPRLHRR